MAVDSYSTGVDPARIQRVAGVVRQFLGGPVFNVALMLAANRGQ